MALTQTQLKEAKLLYDVIPQIQSFINENIIKTNKPMVKTDIFNGLGSVVSNLGEDKFGRAFSVCIRLGKIKGIVSAKRAGYKPIGYQSQVKTDTDFLYLIKPKLKEIQNFVDSEIIENDSAMSSKDIFDKLDLTDMDKPDFIRGFSIAVKEGLITGIQGVKGVGFQKIGTTVTRGPFLNRTTVEDKFSINLSKTMRLCAVDKHNWALQKNQNDVWTSKSYWPDLASSLVGISKMLLNGELRLKNTSISDIRDVISYIKDAESNIIKTLKGEVNNLAIENEEDDSEDIESDVA